MVWPTLGSRTAKEQDRTEQNLHLAPLLGMFAFAEIFSNRKLDSLGYRVALFA